MNKDKATFSVVILAAGEAKRYGSPKQLADFNGVPLLVSVIKKILVCNIEPYVALGANLEIIAKHQAMLPFNHLIIPVKNWSFGLSASIQESVAAVDDEELSGVVFFLGDQPIIEADYLLRFFSRVEQYPADLICTSYEGEEGGGLGVPAYFPRSYFNELSALEGDQGAKQLLKNSKPLVLKYKGSLLDVDEPEDLAHAKRELS